MSILADYADMLHTFNVQAVRIVQGDYGRPPTVEPVSEVQVISGQKLGSKEKIAAGIEAATLAMRLYSGTDLDPNIAEQHTLRMWTADSEPMGNWNLRSRVEYKDEAVILEADRLNTA